MGGRLLAARGLGWLAARRRRSGGSGRAYGDALPRLFGVTRTSGIVIWALPMRDGAGKGDGRRGHVTSFAVALSSGPIREVRRIWADGRELRNAQGDFESATKMRVYLGVGTGEADPLIGAAEGLGRAPGYRGLAYVVFEDLALTPFGNRIPNLSFEVVADVAGPGQWLQNLAGPCAAIGAGEAALGTGYVASAERLTPDIELLARAGGLEVGYPEGMLSLAALSAVTVIPAAALVGTAGEGRPGKTTRLGARPGSLGLSYVDPARDYQAGRQLVSRGRPGPALSCAAPLTATAEVARGLAERWLRQEEGAAEQLTIELPWAWLHLEVGAVIALEGRPERWRIVRRDIRGLSLRLTATLVAGAVPAVASDGGRSLAAPVRPAAPTELTLFETAVPIRPGAAAVWIAAGGASGWRGAEIRQLEAGMETSLARVGSGLPWGRLAAVLPGGPATVWDEAAAVLLAPEPGTGAFESRSAAAVLAGANLVLVGGELLQFRDAVVEPDGLVRLMGLLRGRFGTKPSAHAAETPLRLIRPDLLVAAPVTPDSIGRSLEFLALGLGDPVGGRLATHVVTGEGFGPMAPVHLRVLRRDDGHIDSHWVARGREAFDWGGGEPPLTDFSWRFAAADGGRVAWQVHAPSLSLSPEAQIAVWGGLLPAGEVQVVALGEGLEAARTSGAVALPPAN